jgi:hypothetical protein
MLAAIPVNILSLKSTALVPFGVAYRGSTIGISYNKTVRGLIFFPKSVISLALAVVGHMLGNGSLSVSRTSVAYAQPYFIFTQTVKRFDYA